MNSRMQLGLENIFNRKTLSFSLNYLLGCYMFCLIILLIEKYFHVSHKVFIGWVLLALLIIFARTKAYKHPPARIAFLIVASLISLRYAVWRTGYTLIYTEFSSSLAMMVLYFAELYLLVMHFMGMFVGAWPLERNAAPPEDADNLPTVDIFIPTYNESLDIIKLTATAAKHIKYPAEKFKIYILDDGSTTAKRNSKTEGAAASERYALVSGLARDLGIGYIAREKNEQAKAGNVNFALKRTGGDLVLLLDCDHVPTRDILENTVGFFQRDPKLALVQTPHFMGNPSIIEKNIGSFSGSPRENDMFFNMIHRSLDFWNASYFCGSAAVLKRSALLEQGGLSTDTITEDVETSVKLHKAGYNSVYFRKPMVCGLQPNTFAAYMVQRMRWAQGMTQIFILHNPLFKKGLTIFQKACYFNACYFWFFSFSRLVMYFGPILFLTFGLKIYHASPAQVLSFTVPHVLSIFVVMYFFYGNTRRLFFSEIYESAQMMFLAPAVISTMLNPRKPVFKITPKDMEIKEDALNLTGAIPFFFIVIANAAALPFAAYKWIHFPLYRDVILIGNFWCFYNMLIALMTLGAFFERREFRSAHRFHISGKMELHLPRLGKTFEGHLADGSLSGLGITLNIPRVSANALPAQAVQAPEPGRHPYRTCSPAEIHSINCGDAASVKVTDSYGEEYIFNGKIANCGNRKDKFLCGVEFSHTAASYTNAVKFLYGDSERWAEVLRKRCTGEMFKVSSDMYFFLKRGLQGMLPCLLGIIRGSAEYYIIVHKAGHRHIKEFFERRKTVEQIHIQDINL